MHVVACPFIFRWMLLIEACILLAAKISANPKKKDVLDVTLQLTLIKPKVRKLEE